uniref:Uncharacterized protein n=1 Tax=Plectus sambesii TaxID=2011161 RepID=A0A914XLC1_9BILA
MRRVVLLLLLALAADAFFESAIHQLVAPRMWRSRAAYDETRRAMRSAIKRNAHHSRRLEGTLNFYRIGRRIDPAALTDQAYQQIDMSVN